MHSVIAIEVVNRLRIKKSIFLDMALIFLGSAFVALCSRVAFYLPFSPVPITGQTFAVLLTGAVLGSRRGGLSLAVYVLEGIFGLPVFAGGTSGMAVLFGPTFGYLIGFILAALLVGLLSERGYDKQSHTMFITFLAGQAVIYIFGVWRLSMFVGIRQIFDLGIAPFLIGDFIKAVLAMVLLPSAWKLMSKSKVE